MQSLVRVWSAWRSETLDATAEIRQPNSMSSAAIVMGLATRQSADGTASPTASMLRDALDGNVRRIVVGGQEMTVAGLCEDGHPIVIMELYGAIASMAGEAANSPLPNSSGGASSGTDAAASTTPPKNKSKARKP